MEVGTRGTGGGGVGWGGEQGEGLAWMDAVAL